MVRRSIVLKAALLHGRNASGALPVNETQTFDFKGKGDFAAPTPCVRPPDGRADPMKVAGFFTDPVCPMYLPRTLEARHSKKE